MRILWFISGTLAGISTLSIAMGSVPSRGRVTDDTALYQRLSEIREPKQGRIDFDGEIARLDAMEQRYQERLPSLKNHPRLKGPLARVAQQPYRPGYNAYSKSRTARQ